jgi:hypothetical protein
VFNFLVVVVGIIVSSITPTTTNTTSKQFAQANAKIYDPEQHKFVAQCPYAVCVCVVLMAPYP